MPINKLVGPAVELPKRALDLRTERQGLIQSNIANMNTPGYLTRELPFKQVLRAMMEGAPQLSTTDPRHIPLDPASTAAQAVFRSERRPVDLDEQMLDLAENGLMYQITTRIVGKRLEGIKYAIDEGGK
ncbi:MAG: flagellar basal body rod protein FlgB [Thermodesulfobacteriota bacterium]